MPASRPKYRIWLPDAEYTRILMVTGGREFKPMPEDYSVLASSLLPGTKLIHGASPKGGADLFAHQFAEGLGFIPIQPFWAKWDEFGPEAGPLRNQEMVDYLVKQGLPCLCLAFKGGKGTRDCVARVRKAKIDCYEVR